MQVSNPSKNEVDRIIGTVCIKPRKISNFGNFWEKKFFLRGRSAQLFFESKKISVTLFVYEISRKMVHKKIFIEKNGFYQKLSKFQNPITPLKFNYDGWNFAYKLKVFRATIMPKIIMLNQIF